MSILLRKKERYLSYKGLKRETSIMVHETVFELVNRYCDTNSRILDIGAGSGAFVKLLRDHGFSNVDALEINQEKFKESVKLYSIDLNSNFSGKINNMYDCIVAIEVIEHLENPINFLRECSKILNDGGYLILSTPNIHSLKSRSKLFLYGDLAFFEKENYSSKFGHTYPLPLEFFKNTGRSTDLEFVDYTTTQVPFLLRVEYRPLKHLFISLLSIILNIFSRNTKLKGENLIVVFRKRKS